MVFFSSSSVVRSLYFASFAHVLFMNIIWTTQKLHAESRWVILKNEKKSKMHNFTGKTPAAMKNACRFCKWKSMWFALAAQPSHKGNGLMNIRFIIKFQKIHFFTAKLSGWMYGWIDVRAWPWTKMQCIYTNFMVVMQRRDGCERRSFQRWTCINHFHTQLISRTLYTQLFKNLWKCWARLMPRSCQPIVYVRCFTIHTSSSSSNSTNENMIVTIKVPYAGNWETEQIKSENWSKTIITSSE